MWYMYPHWKAHQLTKDSAESMATWTNGVLVEEIHPETEERTVGLNLQGKNDVLRASEGDYIVQFKNGEFAVWKESRFQATIEGEL